MPVSEVYNEDCMIGMARYPDKFFDLCIVDPPYGINFGEFNRTNTDSIGTRYKANKYKNGDWDKCPPDEQYFKELKRVSKEQIIWGGNYYFDKLGNSKGLICWYKHQPVDNFSDCEFAWNSIDKPAKVFSFPYYGNIEGSTQAKPRIHPTQKSVKLYRWLLSQYATDDMRILDTHLGSGSSAIAAHYFGCSFTGIEIDEDYYSASVKRFKLVTSQQQLF